MEDKDPHKLHNQHHSPRIRILFSVSLYVSTIVFYSYNCHSFHSRGAQNVGNRADNCYAAAQRVIQNQISVPAELSGGNIMLISYYFDRAAEAKLISE